MTIKEFIEKAVEGGWSIENYYPLYITTAEPKHAPMEGVLMSPLAWHAVGIVEMWRDEIQGCQNDSCSFCDGYQSPITGWEYQMHRMIDALCEGKTIEQFLETL